MKWKMSLSLSHAMWHISIFVSSNKPKRKKKKSQRQNEKKAKRTQATVQLFSGAQKKKKNTKHITWGGKEKGRKERVSERRERKSERTEK